MFPREPYIAKYGVPYDAPDPYAGEPPVPMDRHLAPTTQERLSKLVSVWAFAIGGVGVTGEKSDGEKLTREIARGPDARRAFRWLARQHAPIAQLYAYWALRTMSPRDAPPVAQRLATDIRRIRVMHGCILMEMPARAALEDIEHAPAL